MSYFGQLMVWSVIILTIGIFPILTDWEKISYFDFTSQQIPFLVETKRMLESGEPWWSWNSFTGNNFVAAYSFYTLTSPFVWLTLLWPMKKLLWGILLSLYLKTLCAASFSYLYFRRMGFEGNLSIAGALLYAFSSFFICNLYYYHFAEPILLFPLLLIAIETVMHQKKWGYVFLIIISFLITFINYYFAFSSFLLGFLYFIFRGKALGALNAGMMIKALLSVFTGILMASCVLVPVVASVLGSARALPGKALEVATDSDIGFVLKALSKFLPRVTSLFVPIVAESPARDSLFDNSNWISGQPGITVFGLLPFIVYAFRKRGWLTWITVILIFVYLTPLNGIFYLYTSLSYGRWLYGLVLLIILATLYVVRDDIPVNRRYLIFYLAVIMVLIAADFIVSYIVSLKSGETFVLGPDRWKWAVAVVLSLCCLTLWVANRKHRGLIVPMIAVCSAFGFWAFTDSLTVKEVDKNDENDLPLAEILRQENFSDTPEEMYFRTDNLTSYLNAALLYNTPGIQGFHSVYNKTLTPFRSVADYDYTQPYFRINRGSREAVAALLSVKEVRDFHDTPEEETGYTSGLVPLSQGKLFDTYSFRYYIPMGFAYDSYRPVGEIETLMEEDEAADIPMMLLANLYILPEEEKDLSRVLSKGETSVSLSLDSLVDERRKHNATQFKGTTGGFSCHTDFDREKVVFFSVPADPGFTAFIGERPTRIYKVNLGMSAVIVPPGPQTVTFRYYPPGLKEGLLLSALGMLMLLIIVIGTIRTQRKPSPI